jgi:hypothetical protein
MSTSIRKQHQGRPRFSQKLKTVAINNGDKNVPALLCPRCGGANLHFVSANILTEGVKIEFRCEFGCNPPTLLLREHEGNVFCEWVKGDTT